MAARRTALTAARSQVDDSIPTPDVAAGTPPHAAEPTPEPRDLTALLAQGFTPRLEQMATAARDLLTPTRHWDAPSQDALRMIARESEALQVAVAHMGIMQAIQRQALRLAPVELGDVLMRTLPIWQAQAMRHSFELALPGVTPTIIADAEWVELTLNILLEAAVKLTPTGGVVRVSLRPQDEGALVSVRAGAAHLSAMQLAEICEPFARAPRSLEQPGELIGGGLGLPLAQVILAAHGGSLRAEQVAQGSGGIALLAEWPLTPTERAAVVSAPAAKPDAAAPVNRVTPPRARQVALIVEGDARMARYLRANLEARRYQAIVAHEAKEARALIELEEPDIIVLDTGLVGHDAMRTLRDLRDATGAPVLALARRHDPDECARLLDGGAADYLARPVSLDELAARMRAALRAYEANLSDATREPIYQNGDLLIDFAQRSVTMAGKAISLSKTEFKLLRALAQHAGMALTHEAILERVWGEAYSQEIEFVWVYIRRLRRKIEPDPSSPRYILTVPGVGYRLAKL